MSLRVLLLVALAAVSAQAYSGGAPVEVCEDMTPQHPAAPQKSSMPYKVTVSPDAVAPGGVVKVTISGKDGFKGFLLQARQGDTPVGKFRVSDDDRFVKTINCGKGEQNAATHKNSFSKNNLNIEWQAPQGLKDQVQFYVTVALDGATYWVHQPTAKITVK